MDNKEIDYNQKDFIGEGNIIALTNKKLSNIKRNWVFMPILIITNLLFTILLVGFYTIPFINYGVDWLKILFGILWLIGTVLFCDMVFTTNKGGKNEIIVKIFTCLFQIVPLVAIFIHNNLHSFGESITVFKIVLLLCFMLFCILILVIIAKRQPKIFLVSMIMFAVGFLFFCLYFGATNSSVGDETVRRYVAIISAFGLITLLLGFIIGVFFNTDKLWYIFVYFSSFLGAVVLLLVVSYAIHYFDNNISMMSAFVPLFAATLGGGLTLLGVAWTIRKSDRDKQDEEAKRVKPYLKNCFKSIDVGDKVDNNEYNKQDIPLYLDDRDEIKDKQNFELYIKNIGESLCVLNYISVQGKIFKIKNITIEKGCCVKLDFSCWVKEFILINDVDLIACDVYQNYYSFHLQTENLCEQWGEVYIDLPAERGEPTEEEIIVMEEKQQK